MKKTDEEKLKFTCATKKRNTGISRTTIYLVLLLFIIILIINILFGV